MRRTFSKTSTGDARARASALTVESDMPRKSRTCSFLGRASRNRVRPVQGRRELWKFIKLPMRLQWHPVGSASDLRAPPVPGQGEESLLQHADAEYFLAWRDGEPVGRITAQIDRRWDEFQGGKDGQFGFIEAEDDPEVFEALLGTAEEWVAERGRERLLGPMDFTTNDECGLLIEGYERPSDDPRALASAVLPGADRVARIPQDDRPPDVVAGARRPEAGRSVPRRDPRRSPTRWSPSTGSRPAPCESATSRPRSGGSSRSTTRPGRELGFVPVTDEEVRFQAKNLKQVLDENWAFIAERDGETLGAALTLPDINQVLKKMNGRLLPFGWLRFLLGRRKIDRVRVFALGVKPEHQHTGIAARFYVMHVESAKRTPQKAGDQGWILETNEPMNRAMEGMGGEIVKRYRLYEKSL